MNARAERARSIPDALLAVLLRCATGEIPANVALAQTVMTGGSEHEAKQALVETLHWLDAEGDHRGTERLRRLVTLWASLPHAYATIAKVLTLEQAAPADRRGNAVAHWAEIFDRAASISPEAGVAAYSLGDPELLAMASKEIVAWLESEGLLSKQGTALEIGCGIGRLLPLLAQSSRFVVGTEIAPAMARIAQERCRSIGNVLVVRSSGHDLGAFADRQFDLVLAADVFPYLVRSGAKLVEAHFRDSARILRPAGSLVLLNYSYRGEVALDREDIAGLARRHGFTVRRNGEPAFAVWDGLAFHLERDA